MRRGQLPALFLVGLACTFALVASTAIGFWELNAPKVLGQPIYDSRFLKLYAPWEAVRWWWLWGHDPGFMDTFQHGLRNALIFSALFALFCLHMVRSYGPLPHVEAEEQPDRFGTVGELLESPRISVAKKGIVLGIHGRQIVYHVGDDHVLLIGASRVGEKGVSFVLPTLADNPDSILCFDPKHENYEAVADERAKLGPVYLFDATRPGSHKFNPLLEMRLDERNIGDCRAMAMLMTHDMKGRDPFWSTKAADLISALLRIVSIDGGPRTLERLRELIMAVSAGRAPATTDKYAAEMIAAHMGMEWRPRTGVEAQAQLAVSFVGDPIVASTTATSDFQVADLCSGPRPVTVFITLPASQSESLRQLARVVIQAMLLGMLHDRTQASNGARKSRRVTALIDEFPSLGHLPFLEEGMALAAGFGLRLFPIAQSVEQIKETYGSHESILGNCGTIAWVPSFSRDTYEALTSAAGTLVAAMRARHRKLGTIERVSETVSQSRAPVLNPRELQRRSRDEALIFHAGADPTWLKKCRHYQHPSYAGRIKSTELRFG